METNKIFSVTVLYIVILPAPHLPSMLGVFAIKGSHLSPALVIVLSHRDISHDVGGRERINCCLIQRDPGKTTPIKHSTTPTSFGLAEASIVASRKEGFFPPTPPCPAPRVHAGRNFCAVLLNVDFQTLTCSFSGTHALLWAIRKQSVKHLVW